MTTDLRSIGLDYPQWQEALQAAIGTNHLSVIGEVRGGQLVRFEDPSGARLHILGVEPYSTFAGYAGASAVTAHVSSLDDVLALVEIVEDNPQADKYDEVIATATCALAQGPLIVDEGTQTFEHISLAALATDVALYQDAQAYLKVIGTEPKIQDFTGAVAAVGANAGSAVPSAEAHLAGVITAATKKVNKLTNQSFWELQLDLPITMDVLVADADMQPEVGNVIAGEFLVTGDILAPSGCGGGCGSNGCGCGDGGCGGH